MVARDCISYLLSENNFQTIDSMKFTYGMDLIIVAVLQTFVHINTINEDLRDALIPRCMASAHFPPCGIARITRIGS